MRGPQHECLGNCGREGHIPYTNNRGAFGLVCSWCIRTSGESSHRQNFRRTDKEMLERLVELPGSKIS